MTCAIGIYNLIDSATLTNGSWVTTLPLSNLQTKLLGQVARSGNLLAASTKFLINHGTPKAAQVIGLINHNFSLEATVRISVSNSSNMSSPLYDSGFVPVWDAVYNTYDLEWEDDNWWAGTYTNADISGYTPQYIKVLPSEVTGQYWQVEIIDASNSLGVIQVGRVFNGPLWIPERDAEVGLSNTWESDTQMQKALNGTRYYRRRNPHRITRFALNNMSTADAMTYAFELDSRAGIDEEVLWIQNMSDTIHALRRRYLGTLKQLSPIEFNEFSYAKKVYEIEEVV
jgi:hypothetical protein